jgi:xylose isomerase
MSDTTERKYKSGDVIYHKSRPEMRWVVWEVDKHGGVSCGRVTDDSKVVRTSFEDDEIAPFNVLHHMDAAVTAAADESKAFLAELTDLRDRYRESLEDDDEPEDDANDE